MSQILFQKIPALKLIVIVSVVLTTQCQAMERDNSHELSLVELRHRKVICTEPEYSIANPHTAKMRYEPEQQVEWVRDKLLIVSNDIFGARVGQLTVINPKTKETICTKEGNFREAFFCGEGREIVVAKIDHTTEVYAINNKRKSMVSNYSLKGCAWGWISGDEVIVYDRLSPCNNFYFFDLRTATKRFFLSEGYDKYLYYIAIKKGDTSEITIGRKNSINVVDIPTQIIKKTITLPEGNFVLRLGWSPDQKKLFVYVANMRASGRSLWIFSADNFEKPLSVLSDRGSVAKWHNNSNFILTCWRNQIYLQNANNGEVLRKFQKKDSVVPYSYALAPWIDKSNFDKSNFIVTSDQGKVYVRDSTTGYLYRTFKKVAPENKVDWATDSAQVECENLDDTLDSQAVFVAEYIQGLCFNSDCTKIAAATQNSIDIWSIDDEKIKEKITEEMDALSPKDALWYCAT